MGSSNKNVFTTIKTEGGLLPPDLLQKINLSDKSLDGISLESYHLNPNERINEAASRSWNRLINAWQSFREAIETLPENEIGTTITRERWLLILFQELGYGRLSPAKAFEINGKTYPVSHTWKNSPIHLVGFRIDIDKRTAGIAGAARTSPHSLVQELLNSSDQYLWGFVSNGLRLRILRDNLSLTRQAYIEFDLEPMMDGQMYSDFVMLWLLCHQSRVEADRPEECWLERWVQTAKEQGTRALDNLRNGVENSIKTLGGGFIAHPSNIELREKLRSGELSIQDYYRQLLRLVYRLIFLFVAEDRDLLFSPSTNKESKEFYTNYYSATRLRRLAERMRGTKHVDLYQGLRLVMQKLGDGNGCEPLGLSPLGSFLWSHEAIPDLMIGEISNIDLLAAIRSLSFMVEGKMLRAIDYKNIGSEELGSVYESLLELHPELNIDAGTFDLKTVSGHERKTTGSYYTPSSLIHCLLDSALDPVIDEAIKKEEPENALLNLKICDPACGSGHFLIAAAHRLAKRLAAIRTGDDEPSPEAIRTALRDVIGHCIYGVDINPMAVELCKVALWMEALEPGKPLSFLDHRIQCGNSLLGTTPKLLREGIPDSAFQPIEGDDKGYCSKYRKINREEREHGQMTFFDREQKPWEQLGNLATAMVNLDDISDDTIEGIRKKQEQYADFVRSSGYLFGRYLADAWCSAFVWKKKESKELPYPITEEVFRNIEKNPYSLPKWLRAEVQRLANQYQFFHWHIMFPDVFRVPQSNEEPENSQTGWSAGFNVVLGNPPWEKINLKLEEYFLERRPEIASAGTKATRNKLLTQLAKDSPVEYAEYLSISRFHNGLSHYFRDSGVYPATGISRINLYSLFAEKAGNLLAPKGRVGMLFPTGIATDQNNKDLFFALAESNRLLGVFDFENRSQFFPEVDSRFRFCIFIYSGAPTNLPARFGFFLSSTSDVLDSNKTFELTAEDLKFLSPESGTAPIFRGAGEASIARHLYRKHQTIANWESRIGLPQTPFNMANDSHLFRSFTDGSEDSLMPLLEGKHIHSFNWRYARGDKYVPDTVVPLDTNQLQDPYWYGITRHYLDASIVADRYPASFRLVYRQITNATNERTMIASVTPPVAIGHTLSQFSGTTKDWCLYCVSCLNSFAFDFIARTRMSGTSLTHWIVRQIPIPEPQDDKSLLTRKFIDIRSIELSVTDTWISSALKSCGWELPPFCWNEDRRVLLRCELDAAFFHLYLGPEQEWRQLSDNLIKVFPTPRGAVEYILDTFPITKSKDEGLYGEYRTKRVILETYDEMAEAMRTGEPYQTRLDPPPADPRIAHKPRE